MVALNTPIANLKVFEVNFVHQSTSAPMILQTEILFKQTIKFYITQNSAFLFVDLFCFYLTDCI
jgi:hypothetical protein